MDVHLSTPSPFTYLVGEHARAIVAIQDLQREVHSLLSFREHVLEALPHLHLRDPPTTRPRPSPQTTNNGGKSLSEGPLTVIDSGFSTDKASTSMGKSSSSGELSGTRWSQGEGGAEGLPLGTTEGLGSPLGSAEDELLTLLEVIEKKGTRLRRELERIEEKETTIGPSSDPGGMAGPTVNHSSPSGEGWKGGGGHAGDWWPHSLPGAGPRFDFVPGLEAWAELERLRVDRQYLLGRLHRAEAEGGVAHQRLLDLHAQLLTMAAEKRRLEEAFRSALKNNVEGGNVSQSPGRPTKSKRGVSITTISRKGGLHSQCPEDAPSTPVLPRIFRVPVKDKWGSKPPSKIPLAPKRDSYTSSRSAFPHSTSSKSPVPTSENTSQSPIVSPSQNQSGRVVIERERRPPNRVDGGLSMPASLLKGAKVSVKPNKQRISAILKEKDVLALQKQLLTTVMETEILRRQIEVAGDEWENRLEEWEVERLRSQKQQLSLLAENNSLKNELSNSRSVKTVDMGVSVRLPATSSVGVWTGEVDNEEATFSVHKGPNVKYDVVVYDEHDSPLSRNASTRLCNTPVKKAPVEKPPRRTRPHSAGGAFSPGPNTGDSMSYGRDSLGRITRVPLKSPSVRSPPISSQAFRASPSTSISSRVLAGNRGPPSNESSQRGWGGIPTTKHENVRRGSSNVSARNGSGNSARKDSLRMAVGSSSASSSPTMALSPVSKSSSQKNQFHVPLNVNGTVRKRWNAKETRKAPQTLIDASICPESNGCHGNKDLSGFRPSAEFLPYCSPLSPPAPHVPSGTSASADSEHSFLSPSGLECLPQDAPGSQTTPSVWHPVYSTALSFERMCVGPWLKTTPADSFDEDEAGFEPGEGESRSANKKGSLGRDVTTPRFQKSSYKGLRRNYPSGVLRIKRSTDRPSVLPRGIDSSFKSPVVASSE